MDLENATEATFEALFQKASTERKAGANALYTAYRAGVGGIAYNGEKIPEWDAIKWRAKWGWVQAYEKALALVWESLQG